MTEASDPPARADRTDAPHRWSADRLAPPGPYEATAALLATTAFGLAAPVLDVLGRHPQFFVAHGVHGAALVGFALAAVLVVPLVLAGVVLAVRSAHPPAGAVAAALAIGGTAAAFGWYLARTVPLHWTLAGLLALVVGVGTVVALWGLPGARRAVRAGPVAPAVVGAVFLAASPASTLLGGEEIRLHDVAIADPVPVVVIVFDELPMVSLVDDDGEVDADRLPAFGRLAAESVVYREARTVAESTYFAVPALLSGLYPDPERLPVAAHHPDTLFTLLGSRYDVVSTEPITELCPPQVCDATARPPAAARTRRLATDVAIVYLHVVAPDRVAARLPPLGERWAGFALEDADLDDPDDPADAGEKDDPDEAGPRDLDDFEHRARHRIGEGDLADVEAFIGRIAPSPRPVLLHLHSLLPHAPWRYLPTGQRYEPPARPPARETSTWPQDEVLVAQAYQRHLLQVGFADTLLGRVLDALEASGLYDDAIVVVTSDHGAAFAPGEARRLSRPAQRSDIVGVPLIIKPPGGTQPTYDDRPVELVDALPTIAGLLGVDLPWTTDGFDLADPAAGDRATNRLWRMPMQWHEYPSDKHRLAHSLERRLRLLGPLREPLDLYRIGPYGRLVGEEAARLADVLGPEIAGVVDDTAAFEDVDPAGGTLPVLVRATVDLEPGVWVAVTVAGRVAGLGRTFRVDDDVQVQAQIPPETLRAGRNDVRLYRLDG